MDLEDYHLKAQCTSGGGNDPQQLHYKNEEHMKTLFETEREGQRDRKTKILSV